MVQELITYELDKVCCAAEEKHVVVWHEAVIGGVLKEYDEVKDIAIGSRYHSLEDKILCPHFLSYMVTSLRSNCW